MKSILDCNDIMFEIVKFIDIRELYKYKGVSKRVYSICNRVYYKKNKFFLLYVKHFIKPSYFTSFTNFNDKYTYKCGLYIRLSRLHEYLILTNYDIKDFKWFMLCNKLIEKILFKKIEISLNNIKKGLIETHKKLDKFS